MTASNTLASLLAGLSDPEPEAPRVLYGTVSEVGDEVLVLLDGADDASPAACAMAVHEGDRVTVELRGRRVVVTGNVTAPATDDQAALEAQAAVAELSVSVGETERGIRADVSAVVERVEAQEDAVAQVSDGLGAFQETVSGYMSFGVDDSGTRTELALGLEGSDSVTAIDHEGVRFRYAGEQVASIGGDGEGGSQMEIANATVTSQLKMGGFAWIPRGNGNLALKWLGGEA